MGLELVAAAVVQTVTTPPEFQANRGCASVVRNGVGDYTVTLDQPLAEGSASIVCNAIATLAASGLVAFGVTHTSDTEKRVTILQEGAAGAASAPANVKFSIQVVRLTP